MRIAGATPTREDLGALGVASAADLRRRAEGAVRDAGGDKVIGVARELDSIPRTVDDFIALLPSVVERVELRSHWTPGLTIRMSDLLPKPGAPAAPGAGPTAPAAPAPKTADGKDASPTLLQRLKPTLLLYPGAIGREAYGGTRTWAPGGVADTRGGWRLGFTLAGIVAVPVLVGVVIGRVSKG